MGPLEELVRAHTSTPSAAAAPVVADTLSRLSLITRNARRLHKLVNSILRFSSIEAGSVATHFAQQRTFGVVTRRLIECFEPLSSSTGIELCMERGLGLTTEGEREGEERTTFDRETEEGLREDVFVDVELWEQVVFNLISNAFKHTWSGAITCSMYEKMEDGKNGVRFDVADTGEYTGVAAQHPLGHGLMPFPAEQASGSARPTSARSLSASIAQTTRPLARRRAPALVWL